MAQPDPLPDLGPDEVRVLGWLRADPRRVRSFRVLCGAEDLEPSAIGVLDAPTTLADLLRDEVRLRWEMDPCTGPHCSVLGLSEPLLSTLNYPAMALHLLA